MNHTGEYENGTSYGSIYPMDVLSVHQRSQLPLPRKKHSKRSVGALLLKIKKIDQNDQSKPVKKSQFLKIVKPGG